MKKTYFLARDAGAAKRVVDVLLLAQVEARRMHVIARRGTPPLNMPEANLLQKSDFFPRLSEGSSWAARRASCSP